MNLKISKQISSPINYAVTNYQNLEAATWPLTQEKHNKRQLISIFFQKKLQT